MAYNPTKGGVVGYNGQGPYDVDNIMSTIYDSANSAIRTTTKINLSSDINIGNIQVYSTDGTDTGTLYGKADSSGNVFVKLTDGTDNVAVNSDGSLNIGDISAGTQTNDIKVTLDSETVEVVQDTAADLNVTEASASDIKTAVETIDNSIGTVDSAAPTQRNVAGHVAETTVPTAVADGDVVNQWHDEYGRQITLATNLSVGADDVNVVAPIPRNTSGVQTLLNAVTSTGASTDQDVENYTKFTFSITSSSVTSGGVVKIQGSMDGTNYYDMSTSNISSDVTTYQTISDEQHKYMRANLTTRYDGTQ